jgi:hypothetical protein
MQIWAWIILAFLVIGFLSGLYRLVTSHSSPLGYIIFFIASGLGFLFWRFVIDKLGGFA